MNKPPVTVKGRQSGVIEITLDEHATYFAIMTNLRDRMEKMRSFFGGVAPTCVVGGRSLTATQKAEVSGLLSKDYGIAGVEFIDDILREREEKEEERKRAEENVKDAIVSSVDVVSKDYFDAKSVFIRHTVRNGQRVECEGDVVILGDVNAGAEIVAGGSIAVMGALRGLAHAGATGRKDVVIAANRLTPKQLRINSKISIFPEGGAPYPECAELVDDAIVIKAIGRK